MTPQAVAEQPAVVPPEKPAELPFDKAGAIEEIQLMPESATWEQIIEHLSILLSINRGIKSAERGELIPHEEVMRRARAWRGL